MSKTSNQSKKGVMLYRYRGQEARSGSPGGALIGKGPRGCRDQAHQKWLTLNFHTPVMQS